LTEEQVEKVKEKLSEFDFSKFEVHTGEFGFFPSEKYVRVVWIDLVSDELIKLKEEIDKSLLEIGLNHDNREFSSHITGARIKNVKDKEKFLDFIKGLRVKKHSFSIEKVSFMKSELTRDGPVYKTLEEFNLK
jgi:2'-5' RNA ligase